MSCCFPLCTDVHLGPVGVAEAGLNFLYQWLIQCAMFERQWFNAILMDTAVVHMVIISHEANR